MTKRSVRAVATLALAVLTSIGVLAFPVPAQASVDGEWTLTGHNRPTWEGSAATVGTIDFTSSRRFVVDVKVRDVCPPDGASAGVYFSVEFKNHDTWFSSKLWDSDGCGSTPVSYFDRAYSWDDRIVTKVVVHLVLDDRSSSNPHVPIIVASSGELDNPYQPG